MSDTDNGTGSDYFIPDGQDSDVGNYTVIDPGTASPGIGPDPGTSGTRRKGRPPGSRNTGGAKGKAKVSSLDLSALAGILVGTHALIAMRSGIPEWEMPQDEAEGITKATQNVMRHYNIETTQKTIDYAALMIALGTAYGPRILLTLSQKKQPAQKPNDNVSPFRTPYGG